MLFRVSGKNIDLGEALRVRVSERIEQALKKYFDGGYSGHATVEKEAFGFHTECVVHRTSIRAMRRSIVPASRKCSGWEARAPSSACAYLLAFRVALPLRVTKER